MKKFNFDYDPESDDIFVYLEGKKSSGGIEIGNFILDFDDKGDLVAIQILNITEFLTKFFTKIQNASEIRSIESEIINFRNIDGIKLNITSKNCQEGANILIPHIKEKSPVLTY